MDFEKMTLDELKEYAKSINLTVGNIGKEKLINKIRDKEKNDKENEIINSVLEDVEFSLNEQKEKLDNNEISLSESISNAIDNLDESYKNNEASIEDLPINTMIRVKSITFGGLTYKSRINNAIHRWNQIGAEELMSVADLIEMNNYKRDFLNKPFVILLDDRAIKYFRLTNVYKNVAKVNELQKIFNSNNLSLIESTIDTAIAVNMRDIIISKASQLIKNRVLVDINIINLLSRKLKFDFTDLLEQCE